jgi:hypothetical protein
MHVHEFGAATAELDDIMHLNLTQVVKFGCRDTTQGLQISNLLALHCVTTHPPYCTVFQVFKL